MYVTHGLSGTVEYKCWQQIKARCLNPNHRAYPDYGGRGITMHGQWIDDFMAFFDHVGPKPKPSRQYSLDRLDNNKGYVPGNLRWARWKQQARNRRPHGTAQGLRPPKIPGRVTSTTHGLSDSPEYGAWIGMKDRCLNSRSSNYPNWGGRGVQIYGPWIESFEAFYHYVGPRPSPQHSLDRIDNAGHYEPGNVRWATRLQQTRNRRPCKTGSAHANYKHGHQGSPTYSTWGSIKTRCFNPKHDGYARYGAIGITMCPRWRHSFESFLEDLGPKPEHHMIMRKDTAGHYSCGKCPDCVKMGWPANCHWALRSEINAQCRPVGGSRSSRAGVVGPHEQRD